VWRVVCSACSAVWRYGMSAKRRFLSECVCKHPAMCAVCIVKKSIIMLTVFALALKMFETIPYTCAWWGSKNLPQIKNLTIAIKMRLFQVIGMAKLLSCVRWKEALQWLWRKRLWMGRKLFLPSGWNSLYCRPWNFLYYVRDGSENDSCYSSADCCGCCENETDSSQNYKADSDCTYISLTAVSAIGVNVNYSSTTATTRIGSRFELFGISELLRLSLQICVWPRFDGLGQKTVKSQWSWNGVGENLEMTLIINKAKLTRI
jgi:hypothetical protein